MAVIGFDFSILTSYYQAKAGLLTGGTSLSGGTGTGKPPVKLPTPPWDANSAASTADAANAAVQRALLGSKIINLNNTKLDVPGASDDYQKLFALYQGLDTLNNLATRAGQTGVSSGELKRIQSAFASGLAEVGTFTDGLKLDQFRLASGNVADSLTATAGVQRDDPTYVTGPLVTGSAADEVPAFQGNVQFTLSVRRLSMTTDIAVDLSEMGTTPRTLGNVINYLNDKLQAAGLVTRFASQKLPNEPRTVTVGGKQVTLPAVADSWALKVNGDTTEQLTFSAPATAGAVYLAQSAGKPPSVADAAKGTADTTTRDILKFQTDTANVAAPTAKDGQGYWVDGRVFSEDLGPEVQTVRATATGSDGSLYVLADVTGTTDGQPIQGQQDVALMKYDSAGKLIYTRTLGAADTASGYALAVSGDGQVAIAGSVTGTLQGATNGPTNSSDTSGKTDSFVTLFNADGEEVWTERRGGTDDDQASAVAFGDDGTVYVAGRTRSAVAGAGAQIGGWDSYLAAYGTSHTGQANALFTQQFGTAGDDKVGGLAVNGSQVVVAGVESGEAVLRSFAVSTTAVTIDKTTTGGVLTVTTTTTTDGTVTDQQSASYASAAEDSTSRVTYTTGGTVTAGAIRNLGSLQGGDVAGVGFDDQGNVIVAGTTSTNQLDAGTANNSFSGGHDAFVAKLSGDLASSAGDRLTFYGGDGDDMASAVTVSGGQAWIAGTSSSTTLGGEAKINATDGYVAGIDATTGQVTYAQRFTAKDGVAAPTAIAVDPTGASILDTLGLPKGTLDFKDSQLVTAGTSLRAGDQFYLRTKEGALPTAITIAANDTLSSLAQKVRRAAGFSATVNIVRSADGTRSVLQIKPLDSRSTVEIIAGKGGKDALEALGLQEGVARQTGGEADTAKKIYGLKLSQDLKLDNKGDIKAALDQLSAALSKIRSIYRDLQDAANPQKAAAPSGPVPAYLQAQIANYQAGLARLTGGA
jgi:hypothetical protein